MKPELERTIRADYHDAVHASLEPIAWLPDRPAAKHTLRTRIRRLRVEAHYRLGLAWAALRTGEIPY